MATKTRDEKATGRAAERGVTWRRPGLAKVRDVSLFVEIVGHGHPLVLMHGGPSADHHALLPFRRLADQFTGWRIAGRRLIIERAGHDQDSARPAEVMTAVRDLLSGNAPAT